MTRRYRQAPILTIRHLWIRRLGAASGVLFLTVACTRQIYQPTNVRLDVPPGTSLQAVGDAIWRAGRSEEWRVTERHPGLARASRTVRAHRAVVEVAYDQATFSIRLLSAVNLDHDGTRIHKNYNAWIERLEDAITSEVASLATVPPP